MDLLSHIHVHKTLTCMRVVAQLSYSVSRSIKWCRRLTLFFSTSSDIRRNKDKYGNTISIFLRDCI
jgi:hypothetical protein